MNTTRRPIAESRIRWIGCRSGSAVVRFGIKNVIFAYSARIGPTGKLPAPHFCREMILLKAENSNQALPPAVLAYLNAPVQAALQFDFLIGEWAVEGRQHLAGADRRYFATWRAQYLHDKRMIMDDFTVLAGSGLEISAFVTLRTYSPLTERWEMTGMAALQPASNGKWFGSQVGDEMHLEAEGPDPDGRMLKNRIRFYAIKPHRFEWESHVSADGGQTWNKAASLVATRTR